jgi:hypothetical protein
LPAEPFRSCMDSAAKGDGLVRKKFGPITVNAAPDESI